MTGLSLPDPHPIAVQVCKDLDIYPSEIIVTAIERGVIDGMSAALDVVFDRVKAAEAS